MGYFMSRLPWLPSRCSRDQWNFVFTGILSSLFVRSMSCKHWCVPTPYGIMQQVGTCRHYDSACHHFAPLLHRFASPCKLVAANWSLQPPAPTAHVLVGFCTLSWFRGLFT